MMNKANWTKIPDNDAHAFINNVANKADPYVFAPATCHVYQMPLSFYNGYHLVRIINKGMIPYLLLDYISDGINHIYLDGGDDAFARLNASGALNLNESNVIDYVDLYISYVYERGNSLEVSVDKNASPARVTITHDHSAPRYDIDLNLKFQNRITAGRINVTQTGQINVTAPLPVSFLGDSTAPNHTDTVPKATYRHPKESFILEQITDLLSITEIGRAATLKAKTLGMDIRILTSPAYQMFCTDTRVAYITMPATEQNAKYVQALHYIGAVTDIALSLENKHYRPAPFQSTPALDNEAIMMHMIKNLELTLEMCKMVAELEAQDIPEALDTLRDAGLENVYKALKQTENKTTLLQAYTDGVTTFIEERTEG